MISGFGWAALAFSSAISLFFWGSAVAAQAAGRPVWLFARALWGANWLAAMGFRAAFVLAFFGPLLWLAVPTLHKDRIRTDRGAHRHPRPDRVLAARALARWWLSPHRSR